MSTNFFLGSYGGFLINYPPVKYATNLSFITTPMIVEKAMKSVTAYIYISYDKIPRLV